MAAPVGIVASGAQVSSFSPTDITWAAMFWADQSLYQDTAAATPATADGDPVGRWNDGSGNSRNATQATSTKRPTLRTAHASFNSQKVLEFDGTDDVMATGSFDVAQAATHVVIAKSTNTSEGVLTDSTSFGFRQLLSKINATQYRMYAGGSVLDITGADTSAHLLIATYNGTSSSLEKDGSSLMSGSNPGTQTLRGLGIGGSFGGSGAQLAGHIAFIGIKSGTLTAGEKSSLRTWAQGKYGTP